MSSQLQGKDFYERVLNVNKAERQVSTFQIDFNDIQTVDIKDIEHSFIKRGYFYLTKNSYL
jgi:hypothetical protein